jgi:hypothetical protein
MKTTAGLLATLCLACLFTACETVTVTTDHDPTANFANYRTYTLAPPRNGERLSPSSEAALRDSLRTELASRGMTEAPPGKASLDIVRHVFIQEKISVQQYTDWGYYHGGAWPYGYGYYGMWPGAPTTYAMVDQYHEGTMILDFVDAKTKRLVFRGIGQAVVSGPESNAEKIRQGVHKMMEGYPKGG